MADHSRPKPEALTTLLHLVRVGAGSSFIPLPSRALGESLGLSQQAASLRLADLERSGMIERVRSGRGLAVRLTERGLRQAEGFLYEVSAGMKKARGKLEFRGRVFTGFREGGYYVSLKGYAEAFVRALGFSPYPGTLNLRLSGEEMLEQRRLLDSARGIEISGFTDGKRSFGPVKVFRAKVSGKHDGAVLAIERTHYDSSVLEVIAPVGLRKALHLRDGDECSVSVFLS